MKVPGYRKKKKKKSDGDGISFCFLLFSFLFFFFFRGRLEGRREMGNRLVTAILTKI